MAPATRAAGGGHTSVAARSIRAAVRAAAAGQRVPAAQPQPGLDQRIGVKRTAPALTVWLPADEAGGFEHGEVLGGGGGTDREAGEQIAGAQIALRQAFEHRPARGIGKRVKGLTDSADNHHVDQPGKTVIQPFGWMKNLSISADLAGFRPR